MLSALLSGLSRAWSRPGCRASSAASSVVPQVLEQLQGLLRSQKQGRLFAVVHLCGKQFKITSGDLVAVDGNWPPDVGDKIKLDKVLCVGGQDFSLFGQPVIGHDMVSVHATVVEKTLSHTKTHFKKKRRKNYIRINFFRSERTVLRINDICVKSNLAMQ